MGVVNVKVLLFISRHKEQNMLFLMKKHVQRSLLQLLFFVTDLPACKHFQSFCKKKLELQTWVWRGSGFGWALIKGYDLIVGTVRFSEPKKEDLSQDILACCSNLSALTFIESYNFSRILNVI